LILAEDFSFVLSGVKVTEVVFSKTYRPLRRV
jgi:hypothetical protein